MSTAFSLCCFFLERGKLFIRSLFFSSDQDIKHNSLSYSRIETSNVFPHETEIRHIHNSNNENIINLSNNESIDSMITNTESQTRNEYDTHIKNANISVVKPFDTTNMQKHLYLDIETPIDFESTSKSKSENNRLVGSHINRKDDTDKHSSTHTYELNNKETIEALNELQEVSNISGFKNNIKEQNDLKLPNTKTIFVGILIYLARKRLKGR